MTLTQNDTKRESVGFIRDKVMKKMKHTCHVLYEE